MSISVFLSHSSQIQYIRKMTQKKSDTQLDNLKLDLKKAIGQRIKFARRRCKLSQEKLAKLSGHPRITLARVELGVSELPVLELERLAFLLHVPLAYFGLVDKEIEAGDPYQRRRQELAQQVCKIRQQHGLTQVQASQIVGCSVTRWSQIENGHTELHLTEIIIFARQLKIPTEDLLFSEVANNEKHG
jgi:transcriptional regulator with XRE-family HTH domain